MNLSSARILAFTAASMLLALSLSSCWYVKQAGYFLSERSRAQPVSKARTAPGVSASVLAFFDTVDRVRLFATASIGLAPTNNYTRYVTLEKDYVADVVSACASDSFERHYWRYPILGNLPYKGFYDKSEAQKEAARLKRAGLDVIVRPVEAFSSLGYFTDPLYSFMVSYGEDVIAELIIHESAHATLFIKGADQFNEEFATYVGRKGAELYLEERYGRNSVQMADRKARNADGAAFTAFLKGTATLLDEVYQDSSTTKDEALKKKADLIQRRALVYRTEAATRFSSENYRDFDMATINNAFIDLYRLYEEDLALYEDWFISESGESLPRFIASLEELASEAGSRIKQAMAERLAAR